MYNKLIKFVYNTYIDIILLFRCWRREYVMRKLLKRANKANDRADELMTELTRIKLKQQDK